MAEVALPFAVAFDIGLGHFPNLDPRITGAPSSRAQFSIKVLNPLESRRAARVGPEFDGADTALDAGNNLAHPLVRG